MDITLRQPAGRHAVGHERAVDPGPVHLPRGERAVPSDSGPELVDARGAHVARGSSSSQVQNTLTGAPVTWESCGGPGILRVESDHVSSAYVVVNGAMLLSPSDFNPGVTDLEVTVDLFEGTNTLQVELRGRPGSSMTMEFVPSE